MSFLVLDASVWVSRLVPQDAFHALIKDWMQTQLETGTEFISPALLLAEVGGAVSRRTGAPNLGKRAIDTLENLPGLRLIEMDSSLMQESARLAAELGLRGADSTYVAAALHLDLPLFTFDDDQRERAKKRVTIYTITPK